MNDGNDDDMEDGEGKVKERVEEPKMQVLTMESTHQCEVRTTCWDVEKRETRDTRQK